MTNDDDHHGRAASSCATSSRLGASCTPPPGLLRRPIVPHDTLFHNTLLSAVRRLDPGSASHELRHEFCSLWNRLVGSVLDVGRDLALRSKAMCILSLSLMRKLYDSLHEGTGSPCVLFLETMDDLELLPQKSTAYPLCAHSPHRLSPRSPY
jgi:hypothetical protein